MAEANGHWDFVKKNGCNNNWMKSDVLVREIPLVSLQKFRDDCTEKVRRDIEDYFDSFISDIEQISISGQDENINLSIANRNRSVWTLFSVFPFIVYCFIYIQNPLQNVDHHITGIMIFQSFLRLYQMIEGIIIVLGLTVCLHAFPRTTKFTGIFIQSAQSTVLIFGLHLPWL